MGFQKQFRANWMKNCSLIVGLAVFAAMGSGCNMTQSPSEPFVFPLSVPSLGIYSSIYAQLDSMSGAMTFSQSFSRSVSGHNLLVTLGFTDAVHAQSLNLSGVETWTTTRSCPRQVSNGHGGYTTIYDTCIDNHSQTITTAFGTLEVGQHFRMIEASPDGSYVWELDPLQTGPMLLSGTLTLDSNPSIPVHLKFLPDQFAAQGSFGGQDENTGLVFVLNYSALPTMQQAMARNGGTAGQAPSDLQLAVSAVIQAAHRIYQY